MRLSFIAAAGLALLTGCGERAADSPSVVDAWARLPAVAGRPGAAYLSITGGAKPDRLVAIGSAVVGRIELHEGGMHGGMMTMKPITGLDIPAGGKVRLAPGGNHAMLFEIDPKITPGTAIPLAIRFASGRQVEVEAKTVAAGAKGPSD